ncbi:NAD(P)-binding protein [Myriangium duriaei CBS 260.36]|uniref:NAD(P)-binding protein n=1 Tax=Myriangium duriaei CBS 260.36 TaxID=1168546 RepID=A0A9P4JCL6_9PEZI|nr:NAD(P)-binding protein [Myriangium duriaei CBS 260.36]
MAPASFNVATDIPDLSGKVIFITGGNSGIGAETVRALAAHNPACIYLCTRKTASGDALVASIKETVPEANVAASSRLDILILNAGIAGVAPGLTKEGYEMHFGTNYVGHAMLTQLLLPKMLQTKREDPSADLRIHVTASQAGVQWAPGGGLALSYMRDPSPGSGGTQRYGHSKLANLLFMRKLSQQYPSILIMASHPGTVKTESWGKVDGSKTLTVLKPLSSLVGVTSEEGAKNQLWCVTTQAGPNGVEKGKYYVPFAKEYDLKNKNPGNQLQADQLWHWTNDEFRKYGMPGWPEM